MGIRIISFKTFYERRVFVWYNILDRGHLVEREPRLRISKSCTITTHNPEVFRSVQGRELLKRNKKVFVVRSQSYVNFVKIFTCVYGWSILSFTDAKMTISTLFLHRTFLFTVYGSKCTLQILFVCFFQQRIFVSHLVINGL